MNLQRELPRMGLRFAKLCMELDCNTVFDSATFRHCPTCGSVEFYPLESWLNRERPETASVVIGDLDVDRAGQVTAMPRPLWLERLRAKRAESDGRLTGGPIKLQARLRRRRAS
jgi:hypothetical protein